jgi:hypothetical protein
MRGILRTVSTIAFCVVIVVSIVGCRTGRENNEPSVSQTPAGGATSAAGKSVDGVTTNPGGADATKPVGEPNEPASPARPPILYGRESDILPLSDGQVRRVKGIVAEEQPGKEIWFIYVPLNKKMSRYDVDVYNYRVVVYCKPDQQSARVRRGAAVYAGLSGRVLPPIVHPFSYAHLCETDAGFFSDLGVPNDLDRLPLKVSGDISDEDIIEVVRFIRSSPSAPERLIYGPDGRTRRFYIPNGVLDPAASLDGIRREGDEISVYMAGPQSHTSQAYRCRKIGSTWMLVKTESWVE